MEKNKLSFQLNADDFLPAGEDEKKSLVVMRESVGFWKDACAVLRRTRLHGKPYCGNSHFHSLIYCTAVLSL